MEDIVSAVNGRSVLVDACVSKDIAQNLEKHGIRVRHVGDINPHMKDEQIALLMYPDEVLITRDYGFYKSLGPAKAILLMPRGNAVRTYEKKTKAQKRLEKRHRMSAELRYAIRELLEKETRSGELHRKILFGIFWMLGYIRPEK